MKTILTERFGIEHPIFSAGMARVAQAELTAAVSNAGGMGCLGGVSYMPEALTAEIEKIESLTDKPYAINLLLPASLTTEDEEAWRPVRELWGRLSEEERGKMAGVEALLTKGAVADQVEIVLDAAPAAVTLTFAVPDWFMEECRKRDIATIALAGSVGKAREYAEAGVDFIVAQGTEAGGHTGYVTSMTLIPAVVDAVDVPVIAAGGIADGRGLASALSLGACGAWVGTRFIATPEAYGHDAFKQRVIDGRFQDTTITFSYSGKRMRAFSNDWTQQWESSGEDGASGFPAQYGVAATRVETGYQDGDLTEGMMPVGQTLGLVHEMKPAGEVVRNMSAEADQIISALHERLR